MKILGAFALLVCLVMMIFTVLAYSELRTAATSVTPPSPDSMPLTRIVGPELFDTGNAVIKPAELASMAFNRIYIILGASLFSLVLGTLLLVLAKSPKLLEVRHHEAEPT
jgi:hypothetical protein